MKYTKPKFKIGDSVRISKTDITFQKGYNTQFTDKMSAISTKKHPAYIMKDLEKKKL